MQDCKNLKTRHLHLTSMLDQSKEILNIRRVRNNNNKGSRSNVTMIKKVKDFSFIRKEPYRDIFNQIQILPPSPRCLFIICVIVYNLYNIVVIC